MSKSTNDPQTFYSHFGYEPPTGLLDFLESQRIRDSLPAVFFIKSVKFVIEIQYFLDIYDSVNFCSEQKQLAFAVTSDGDELAIDLSQEKPEILQIEDGDVDTLGIPVWDLLDANYTPLG